MAALVVEDDRRRLLADNMSLADNASSTMSYVHSSAASVISTDTVTANNVTHDNDDRETASMYSVEIQQPTKKPYRGYESEDAYLAALRAFLEEKQYIQMDTALVGWYGKHTMAERIAEMGPGPSFRFRKSSKDASAAQQPEQQQEPQRRRATVDETANASPPKSGFRWPGRRRSTLTGGRQQF